MKNAQCIRCEKPIPVAEGYNESQYDICETCYTNTNLEPTDIRWSLFLFYYFHSRHKNEPLAPFWPRKDGFEMSLMDIFKVTMSSCADGRNCIDCMCILKKYDWHSISPICDHCIMHENTVDKARRTNALLLWWLLFYDKKQHVPYFWPRDIDGKCMSPIQVAEDVISS